MDPTEIRRHILEERRRSREVLGEAREIARRVLEQREEEALDLHDVARRLEDQLASLYDEEEEVLDPALRETDAWGAERASGLEQYHRAQRQVVRLCCAEVFEGRLPAWSAANELLELIEAVEEGLTESERTFLSSDLLRDDLVSIRQSGG